MCTIDDLSDLPPRNLPKTKLAPPLAIPYSQPREERPRDPKFDEIPSVAFDVAKSYLNGVAPDKTAMGSSLLEDVKANIQSGKISDMTQFDAFVKASKKRHPRAWAFRAQGVQQKDLAKYLQDHESLVKEDWLLYKIRQELHEYDMFKNNPRGVLKLYFDKLERGVLKNPAIDQGLAGALHSEFFKKDCSLDTLADVEELIMAEYEKPLPGPDDADADVSDIKLHCRKSVFWKPTSNEEASRLMKQIIGKDFMDIDIPGNWMKLKLREHFSEFIIPCDAS